MVVHIVLLVVCQMAERSNCLNSTRVWVISSLGDSIVKFRPRLSKFSIGLVNTTLDSLNTILIPCSFNDLFDIFTEEQVSSLSTNL